jgi:hypothetical protein
MQRRHPVQDQAASYTWFITVSSNLVASPQ